MAQNLKNEEIRNQRVIEIGNYVKETGASTRQAAAYFSKHHYPISAVTVNDYLRNRLPKINPVLASEVASILDSHMPKTVELVEVKKRVYQAVSLLFQDYTIAEIAEQLHSTPDIIYQDLTVRLKKMEKDEKVLQLVKEMVPSEEMHQIDIVEDVREVLARHSLENLMNQKGNPAPYDKEYFQKNQVQRDAEGKFVSFPKK